MLPLGHRLLGDALAAQGRLAEAVDWLGRWLAIDGRAGASDSAERERVTGAISAARMLDAFLRGERG